MQHTKLTATDRKLLSQWKKEGLSNKECARRLNQHAATIGRELKRNKTGVSVGREWEIMYEPQLRKLGYDHEVVNHGKTFVVNKIVHTENIEGIWGRIKPALKGTYRKVSSKYLEMYINEFCFRYNYRKTPQMMFDLLLTRVAFI